MTSEAPDPPLLAEAKPALARLADALGWPLMVLDATGRLQHANRAARLLLARGDPLQRAAGRPVQPVAEAQRLAFRTAVHEAAAGAITTTLCWPATAGLCSLTLHPLPGGPATPPRCLLTLAPAPARAWRPDVAAQALALALSATQTRVLHLLAQGHDTASMAAALGITAGTVRSHVATLRQRSGHATRAALVLALQHLPPVVGSADEGSDTVPNATRDAPGDAPRNGE